MGKGVKEVSEGANGPSDAAAVFRALGEETRLRIVERLSSGTLCVCDLATEIGAKQPLLSFHLKTLREAGVVDAARKGRWIYYSLNDELLGDLAKSLTGLAEASRDAAPDASAEAACC